MNNLPLNSIQETEFRGNLSSIPPIYIVQSELCKRSFYEFIKRAWKLVDPAPFSDNWHIGLLAEYLQATISHNQHKPQITRLAINISPRCMKSKIVSVLYPAWYWGAIYEKRKFLCASYSEAIALQDAEDHRNLVQSPWYKSIFPNIHLSPTQNEKSYFRTWNGGYRISTSVGGKGAALGGDCLILDDILNSNDRFSDTEIKKANTWYTGTMSSRLNNPRTGVKIVVGQRLNENDVFSLLEAENYQFVILPMEYRGKIFVPGVNLPQDPRKEPGELFWKDRFGPDEVQSLKDSNTDFDFQTQYNQNPAGLDGRIFKKNWFIKKSLEHIVHSRWLSWDCASTTKDSSCYSAVVVGELDKSLRLHIIDMEKFKLEFMPLTEKIIQYNEKYRELFSACLIESKSAGEEAISVLRQTSPTWMRQHIISINPKGSKPERGYQAALWAEKGCILLPPISEEKPWVIELQEAIEEFPAGSNGKKDIMDSFNQLIIYLSDLGFLENGYRDRLLRKERR